MAASAEKSETRPYLVIGLISTAMLTAAVTWAAFAILRPTPPRRVVMATGPEGSNAMALGIRYREILARDRIELRLVPTAGAVENAALLRDRKSDVSIAIIPGGITNEKESPNLVSLGTLFYEPLWLFIRVKPEAVRGSLRNMRFSVGPEGSGSRALALEFFAQAGIIDQISDKLLPLTPSEAAEKVTNGELDGCVLLESWESQNIHKLLAAKSVHLFSIRRADAMVALYPFLNKVVLPAGVADMAENIPPEDVILLAPKASLIVRDDLHTAIQYLLLEAALEIHSEPGVFRKAGEFPAPESIDLPLSEHAVQFYKKGRPFLQRNLPFWLAVLVQQILVLLIPVLGVLYPVVRLAPQAFGWVIRRRVFRLYKELILIENEMDALPVSAVGRKDLLCRLNALEDRVIHCRVPASFEPLVFDLRFHMSMVRERLERS